jgi:hypothetical protein
MLPKCLKVPIVDQSDSVTLGHRFAPGDDFCGQQIALLEGFDDHLQTLLDVVRHQALVTHFDLMAALVHQFP